MAETKLGFRISGIATELDTRRLTVPLYQRSYAWGSDSDRDQVMDFWTDIRSTFTANSAEYFLGTMVLSRESKPGRAAVIDGQQRIATTAILIASIRDEFRARGDTERANIIQTTYLAKSDLRTAEPIPQLELNPDDEPYFHGRIVRGDATTKPTRASHELIDRAYHRLRANVAALASDAGNKWNTCLLDLIDFLRDRVQIIVVEVPTEADAFLIFETLNDRGADLTIADLLKNYLFGTSKNRLDTVRNCWVAALSNLDIATAGSHVFTKFLRQYWSSIRGVTRERDLYTRIKEEVTSPAKAVAFAEQLQRASRLYAAILNRDHHVLPTRGTGTKRQLDVLATLQIELNQPLILAALEHFAPADLTELLRYMISWGVRGLIGGAIGDDDAERRCCEAAVKIRTGAIATTTQLRQELDDITPTDEQFRTSFATAQVARPSLARYLLIALEKTLRGEEEPELVPNGDEAEVNLEHILPLNPRGSDWMTFGEEEERRLHVYRIGNLALLSKEPNGRIGNRSYSVKRPVLARSHLLLTKGAGQETDWTPETITRRQERLAELAIKTWPV